MTEHFPDLRRIALYARVSTARQAEADLSIPDQIKQGQEYCERHGWKIVATFVEPGVSATDDRRPEFLRMIDMATARDEPVDIILVHSLSRFSRDQFIAEFLYPGCCARLAWRWCPSRRTSAATTPARWSGKSSACLTSTAVARTPSIRIGQCGRTQSRASGTDPLRPWVQDSRSRAAGAEDQEGAGH